MVRRSQWRGGGTQRQERLHARDGLDPAGRRLAGPARATAPDPGRVEPRHVFAVAVVAVIALVTPLIPAAAAREQLTATAGTFLQIAADVVEAAGCYATVGTPTSTLPAPVRGQRERSTAKVEALHGARGRLEHLLVAQITDRHPTSIANGCITVS
jgi:hypothetical protein